MLLRIRSLMPCDTHTCTYTLVHPVRNTKEPREWENLPLCSPSSHLKNVLPLWLHHMIFFSLSCVLSCEPSCFSLFTLPFASFCLLSLICNEAAQLPEGQCRISLRDQREGHIDKESCHQILQLHIKCTVHDKDREGAGRALGGLGRSG